MNRPTVRQLQATGSPPQRPGAAAPGGLTGRDVLRILRKRKWLILICLAASTTLACVGTLLWLRYAPAYTAKAILAVNPPNAGLLGGGDNTLGSEIERIKQDHVRLIRRQKVFQEAAKDIIAAADKSSDPQQYSWVNRDRANLVRRLIDSVVVSSVRDTGQIELAMSACVRYDQERVELAELVTLVAKAYVREARDSVIDARHNDLEKLEAEKRTQVADLEKKHREMARLGRDGELIRGQNQRDALNVTLEAMTREAADLEIQIERARSAYDSLKKDSDPAANLEVLALVDQDPDLRTLLAAEVSWSAELATSMEKFGARHRKVQDVQARLNNVRASVQTKRQELVERIYRLMLDQRKLAEDTATLRLSQVQTRINDTRQNLAGLQANLNLHDQLSMEIKILEGNIARIDNRLLELRLQRAGDQPISVKGEAEIPDKCSSPKWSITIPLGVLLGLAVSLGLAFLLELADTSIRSLSDLSRRLDLPVLGMIPHAADLEDDVQDARLAFLLEGDSIIGDAFRQVRTCVQFSCRPEQRRSLVVTSPLPQDGRTTVATNLAAAFARSGKRVLLVDANFRQSVLHKLFPEVGSGGLSNVLTAQQEWADLVHRIEDNFDILPAGPTPPNPAELLGGQAMRRLLDETTQHYDLVLFDAAPCLVVSDAAVLAAQCDAVILVVRAGANTHGILQRSRDIFSRIQVHVLGAVLNAVRVTAGGYLRKNYEAFYGYRDNGDSHSGNGNGNGERLPAGEATAEATATAAQPPGGEGRLTDPARQG